MHCSRLLLLAAALGTFATNEAAAQDVTLYRCVAGNGNVSLQDSPCPPGQSQEVRSMQRPRDPPPPIATPAPVSPPVTPPTAPVTQIVYRTAPRPMYECIDPDGQRYTSDNDEGNPRWVPTWTWAPAIWPRPGNRPTQPRPPRPPVPGQPAPPPVPPSHPRPPSSSAHGVILPAGGAWVRDECQRLSQRDICARLSDRRYDILRRYHSATQSERRQLDREQEDIDSRMANDCGRL